MAKFSFCLTFGILLITQNSNALPLIKTMRAPMSMPSTFTRDYDFEGIVSLSNCSGSLVQFEGAPDTDFAMVLTNGHCVGAMIDPDEYIYGRASSRQFGLHNSSGDAVATLTATKIIYATMTKTDLALYKLNVTYAQIERQENIRPLILSSTHPKLGQQIEVISGYWNRGYRCNVEAFPYSLVEGEWTWIDSIRYSRPGCEVIGGTSGSPIIASGTRTVIGINNTGNENGERCTDNNPCEVDEKGNVTFYEGHSYGQQILWIYSCLNESREIDLQKPGCQLPH